jgi:hypothetical protein
MTDDKKIIIDEDWKSQVQAEKEAAGKQPPATDPASKTVAQAGESTEPDDIPMPPASFEMLLSTLVTEAMLALGQIPHPATGQPVFHPQQAKYIIDTLDMLREKTQGNLTPDEAQLLETLLHQLRMAFVQLTAPAAP